MKIKFGAWITAGRGSVGGTTASWNTYGAYAKNKSTPVNPSTTYQQNVRMYFAMIAQYWRGLTQNQRDLWVSMASEYKATNIFGDLFTYTGFNLFMKLNRNLLEIGESIIDDCPSPQSVMGFTDLTFDIDITAVTAEATFAPAIDADTKVIVYATAPQSPGKSFVKSEYRKIDVLDDGDTSPVDMVTAYLAKFGTSGVVGNKIFIMFRPINLHTGQAGTIRSNFAIAHASTP